MSKTLRYASAAWILGGVAFGWMAGCSSSGGTMSPPTGVSGNPSDAASTPTGDSASTTSDGGVPKGDGGASGLVYTLIDDMETTTHGPIELRAGINPPESPAYWFNFGATVVGDTAVPPYTMFTFSALPVPTTTLNGKTSAHAAHQLCTLNGLYDVCGVGLEFAQVPDLDGGAVASLDAAIRDAGSDGGDGGPGIPMVTVPFDISQYKGITFWGKTSGVDAGGLDVKVIFPNTDTDPRGGVCNGPNSGASSLTDLTLCFNSYAEHVTMTADWQQFTIMFLPDDDAGITGLTLDPSFGIQPPLVGPWTGTNVYGIQWQGQDNNAPDSGVFPVDIWVDDVYFIQ